MTSTYRVASLARISIAVLALAACGTPPDPAAPDLLVVTPPAIAWLEAGTPPVALPDIPWLELGTPITRACPTGWSSAGDRCTPWATGTATCTGAMLRAPGEAACRPLSPSCPAGDFASDLPAGVLYVLAGAPAGGDGSPSLPFGTLAEALSSAGPGATVALSRGTHPISGAIDLDVSLRGACASETILEAVGAARFAIATSLTLEDLTMQPGDADDPIFVEGPYDVSIHRTLLEGGRGYGITASGGATVELMDVRVAGVGVRAEAGVPPYSAGIVAQSGGVLTGARVVVDDATWVGASAEAGRISLTDSVLRGTHEDAVLSDAAGATCWVAGTVELTRSVVESSVSRGVEVLEGCTQVTLDDVVIQGTRPGVSTLAYGIVADAPTTAHGLGFFDNAESAVVSLTHGRVEVDDLDEDRVSGEGTGLASTGGTVVVHRAIVRGTTVGLFAQEGGHLDAEDVRIDHAAGGAAQAFASSITLRRGLVNDVALGLYAADVDGSLVASDVVIERVGATGQPDSDALTARAGARLEAQRCIVRDAMGTAVAAVQPDAVAIVSDLTVVRGAVAFVALSGTVEVTRADVDAQDESGAQALDAASRISLTDVRIHDVVVHGARTGGALLVADGAELTLSGVVVERVAFGVVVEATSLDQPAPHLRADDVVFSDLTGPAIELSTGTAELTRLRIERAGDAGLIARGARSHVTLGDVAIAGLAGRADGQLGRGLHVASGAHVEGARVTIDGALGVGLFAADPGTSVSLEDVSITHTGAEACGAACASRAAGHGVASLFEADVTLTRVRVLGSEWAGVLVSDGGLLTLTSGLVDGNRVGRAVLGSPPTGLTATGVVYVGNEVLEARDGVVVPPASLL